MAKQSLKKLLKRKPKNNLLVLDIGTTGIKAFVFNKKLEIVVRVYKPLKKYFPQKGWVEQNPQEFVSVSKKALQQAVRASALPKNSFFGLAITNQRETTILWNKKTGKPVYPAIVWEDVRTKNLCADWRRRFEKTVRQKTGLSIEPYFSASKIRWILDNIKSVKLLLQQKRLVFGTVDSWIMWNFLKGKPHLIDYTNASRTLLFNIKTLAWDRKLGRIFQIPPQILPCAKPSQSLFGTLQKDILGVALPVRAVCGDQQASMYAAGIKKGTAKTTYGTGTFIMQILGPRFKMQKPFFTTLAPNAKRPFYALEAKIDCCGRKINSLLKKPKLLRLCLEKLARGVDKYLRKLPYQPKELIIDGGVTQAAYLVEIQSKISDMIIKKQKIFDGTALGAAMMMQKQERS